MRVTVTEIAAERPANFELPREWVSVVEEVERHRSFVSATALVDVRSLPAFREYFGRHCEVLEPQDVKAHLARLGAELVQL